MSDSSLHPTILQITSVWMVGAQNVELCANVGEITYISTVCAATVCKSIMQQIIEVFHFCS